MSWKQKMIDFFTRRSQAVVGGGEKAMEKQIAMGKMTARDRITALVDPDTFHEYDLFVEHKCQDFDMNKKSLPADGVITGTGKISGYPVASMRRTSPSPVGRWDSRMRARSRR
jgi:methylmalonyl-CoA decarboxylase subunit alpha